MVHDVSSACFANGGGSQTYLGLPPGNTKPLVFISSKYTAQFPGVPGPSPQRSIRDTPLPREVYASSTWDGGCYLALEIASVRYA